MTSGRPRHAARARRTAAPSARADVGCALGASGDAVWDWTLEGFADATDDPPAAWLALVHPDDRRTPLNAVLGLSQLLAAGPSDPPSERQATQFEAIQHAGWHLPALILLDMYLSGLQVLDALRADPATRALRVVALSASAMSEEVASARKRGVLECWTKPLGMDRCLADVQRLLAPVPT